MKDEFARIDRINEILGGFKSPNGTSRVELGIGDDAAILAPLHSKILFCSDSMIEAIHFDLNWITPEELGHKAVASTLSDIAAMNGAPRAILISLAMPASVSDSFIEGFFAGAGKIASRLDAPVVGGDLTSSPQSLFIDIAAIGETTNPIRRSGAAPGDWLAVSGTIGTSAAGLHSLKKHGRAKTSPGLLRSHVMPEPRFDCLRVFEKDPDSCHALIDISDGLSSEVHHLAKASGVGIELEAGKIPIHPEAKVLAQAEGVDALTWALSGGEDYQLLACFSERFISRLQGAPEGFTLIGRIRDKSHGVQLIDPNGTRVSLHSSGFNHFSG